MLNLRNVLIIDAVSSAAAGILLIALPDTLADLFGTQHLSIIAGVGVFLLLFALFVYYTSRNHRQYKKLIYLVILLNVLWVLDSIGVIVLRLFNLAVVGYAIIGAIALWVSLMVYLQASGLKKLKQN